MPLKLAPLLILAIGGAVIGYGIWYRHQHPPRVVSSGVLKVTHPRTGEPHVFETRVVEIGAHTKTELRTRNGAWIDCAGDCREAALREYLDVFEKMRERGN